MSTADIQLSVVFGGQYSFEKLQSDWEQNDSLERNFIVNKPDLVNFEAETVTAETVIFEENPTGYINPLKLQYNPTEKTIEFGLKDGGVLQLGKEMFEEYTNVDTVALTNGMIVSTAAISGNRKGIKRTDFTNLTSIRSIVGMVTVASIGTNQSGRVTTKGIINDLNTNGIGEGSQLWGNPSVLGGWSGSKPAKPQYAVQIGQVVVAHANVGSIELNIAKDVKFSDLADVNGSTNLIDNTDTIPKRDADGIIREISVADIKADFKADTDLIYEPLLGFTPEDSANKGQANGYASLGADGLVPSNQLPSFVDDVLEFANLASFPATGETGKIYVAKDTNKTYRWSGSTYIYITSGAVDSVAGKTGVVTLVKADVGLGNVDNTSDVNKPVSTLQQNALDLKIDKTLSSEITTVGDSETMAVKASDSIWKRITWSNIKATLKTYFEALFVTLTGAQNVAGVKTFTDSPVVPTPVNNTDAANKAYVQSVITVGNDTYQENKLITDARVAALENTINSANINQETTATVSGVDTIALPKTAANTGMQVQMFGQSAEQIISNGNFANGLTNWIAENGSTNTMVSGNLVNTGGSTSALPRATRNYLPGALVIGNKYYLFSRQRVLNASCTSMVLQADQNGLTANSIQTITTPIQNTWYNLSGIFTATFAGGLGIRHLHIYADAATANGKQMELDYSGAINLTATFGAGNEPTKEQCDLLFANYFEGSDNVLGTGRISSPSGKNLFNKLKVTPNKSINATGGLDSSSVANASEFIPVKASTTYKFSGGGNAFIAYYNALKQFISSTTIVATSSITTPANTAFVRFSILYANMNTLQFEMGGVSTSYESYRESALYLTTPELRSNGLVKDEIRKGTNGYELVKRVGVGTLGANGITGGDFEGGLIGTKTDGSGSVSTWTLNTVSPISGAQDGRLVVTTAGTTDTSPTISRGLTRVSGQFRRFSFKYKVNSGVAKLWGFHTGGRATVGTELIGAGVFESYYVCTGTLNMLMYFDGRNLFDIQLDDIKDELINTPEGAGTGTSATVIGSNIHYTLATPVITPIPHAGLLNSNSNGTAYFEPIIADAGVYASNIAIQLTDYPIASFESIRKYANGTYTELSTATAVIAGNGLSFTHPDLAAGDLVMFTYAYNRESIGRSMTLTHYDSRFVIADTANSKVYRWRITSTNGVASIALTEV